MQLFYNNDIIKKNQIIFLKFKEIIMGKKKNSSLRKCNFTPSYKCTKCGNYKVVKVHESAGSLKPIAKLYCDFCKKHTKMIQ